MSLPPVADLTSGLVRGRPPAPFTADSLGSSLQRSVTTVGSQPSLGDPLSSVRPNRNFQPSNRLAVASVKSTPWEEADYESTLPTTTMVLRMRTSAEESLVLSVGQCNELIRMWQASAMSEYWEHKKNGSVASSPVAQHVENYLEQGEAYFSQESVQQQIIKTAGNLRHLAAFSITLLRHYFNFLGMLAHGDVKEKRTKSLAVGIKGLAQAPGIANVWGKVRHADSLYFVLKKTDGNVLFKKGDTYKHFQFVPYFGNHSPAGKDLYYEDEAGFAHDGHVFYIGRVVFLPKQANSHQQRESMMCLSGDSRSAYTKTQDNRSHIGIELGIPVHQLETYGG